MRHADSISARLRLVMVLISNLARRAQGHYQEIAAHVGQMVADRTPNSACTNATVTRLTL